MIKKEALAYASELEDLAVGVLKVLEEFPQGLLLSQVKPHLQSKCSVSLSEASFGCSKLQEVFRMPPLDKIFPMEVVPDRNEILIKAPDKSVIPEILRRRLKGGGKGVGKDGKKGALSLETKAKGNVKGQAKASAPSKGKGKGKTYAVANAEGKWSDW